MRIPKNKPISWYNNTMQRVSYKENVMHKVAKHNGYAHHKHPHVFKKQLSKKAKLVMPLLLSQYKKMKQRPLVTMEVAALGIGLISAAILWIKLKK